MLGQGDDVHVVHDERPLRKVPGGRAALAEWVEHAREPTPALAASAWPSIMVRVRCFLAGILALLTGCTFDTSGAAATGDGMAAPDASIPIDAVVMDARGGIDAAIDAPESNARRKSITIDPNKVSGAQTDFPVWIDLVDADIAARAQQDGHDIYFTAADGNTRLDYEIQGWNASAHRLGAWVRVPMLSDAAPTVLFVNYGDPSTTAAPNPAGVFRSSFSAVWHLDDATAATTIADATGTHPGTPMLTAATRANAQLGAGLSFTGNNDQITFQNPLSGNRPHTISVWVNQSPVTHPSSILVVGSAVMGQSRWLYGHYTGPAMAVGYYSLDWTTTTGLDGGGWTLVHWVFEGANGTNRLYANGQEVAGSPQVLTGINTTGTTGVIGHAPEPAYGTNMGLLGTIDELRIATVARSAGWILTEYHNQSSPSTFYTVGAEQPVP